MRGIIYPNWQPKTGRRIASGCEWLREIAKVDGKEKTFKVIARLNAHVDLNFYQNGGILDTFLRNMLNKKRRAVKLPL